MRIHIYLREFPAAGDRLNSGLIKAVHGLAAGFSQNGAQVTVLCCGQAKSVVNAAGGYEIRCFAQGHSCSSSLPRELERYIEQCDASGIFLLNGVFSPNVYLVSRACVRNNIPYIIAPHDPYHPSIFASNRHLKWPYWYLCERPMLRHAAAIHVLDIRHADFIRELGVQTPVIEVINGFAAEDVHDESSLEWRMDGKPRLLYLGRVDSHNKGLDLLLDAFAAITNKTDATLTIQGPDWGDRDAIIKRAQRLKLNDRIEFHDADFDRSPSLIAAEHDVFVLPSRFEGFGLSALEAMLAGRPVVVPDVAGIAPHVRASGCGIVISSDVAHIKSGLMEILSLREKWKEMGLAGRAYALANLRWDRIAADTIEQYRTMFDLSAIAKPKPFAAAS